jgi:hypothetical protein
MQCSRQCTYQHAIYFDDFPFLVFMLLIRTRALIWPRNFLLSFFLSVSVLPLEKNGKDGSASRLNSRTWIVLSYDERRRLQDLLVSPKWCFFLLLSLMKMGGGRHRNFATLHQNLHINGMLFSRVGYLLGTPKLLLEGIDVLSLLKQ